MRRPMAFCRERRSRLYTRRHNPRCDRVVRHLAGAGIKAMAIHGNKSQSQRTHALQAFRSGEIKLLVATDIAARGIDVSGVSHVINFEIPNVPRSEEHTSELQSLMRISYAVFCLKKKKK